MLVPAEALVAAVRCSACCCSGLYSCTAEAFQSKAVEHRVSVSVNIMELLWQLWLTLVDDGIICGHPSELPHQILELIRNWHSAGSSHSFHLNIIRSFSTPAVFLPSQLYAHSPLQSCFSLFFSLASLFSPRSFHLPLPPPFPLSGDTTTACVSRPVEAATGGCHILQRAKCLCVEVYEYTQMGDQVSQGRLPLISLLSSPSFALLPLLLCCHGSPNGWITAASAKRAEVKLCIYYRGHLFFCVYASACSLTKRRRVCVCV